MSLESATFISQLVVANPTGGDPRSSADDHLRLIKTVLQATFTALSGSVNAAHTDLNLLTGRAAAGLTSADLNLLIGRAAAGLTSADLNLLIGKAAAGLKIDSFPAGAQMAFYMSSPPSGWLSTNPLHDSMMRVVNSGTSGGSGDIGAGHSPILNNVVPYHNHTYGGTTGYDSVPHTHPYSNFHWSGVAVQSGSDGGYGVNNYTSADITDSQSLSHAHGYSGTTDGNGGSRNWQPRYLDFCIGMKS